MPDRKSMFMFVTMNAEMNSARCLMREGESGFVTPAIIILKMEPMPSLAVANNLELADIPPELCDLNILERHLIAKCITFAKIIPLPKGRQRAIHGNVVCVPSEVQETVDALPRLRSESQVMRVKLKRRLCYRGHQLFQTVTWSKLVQALHKLKHIHPQFVAPVSALIAAVYRPPDYSVSSFLANLGSLLDSLEIMDCHPIIVCGDFNENIFSNARDTVLLTTPASLGFTFFSPVRISS
ncbi:hypothetical protein L3Q82_015677 [Scortum barcoo]|uniref:Uncharacterized protein n=1 Tax=Scortum barcoo TaxID=214431 RepID=A0ACB8VNL1_9TELE|nr:hypothetical protein L3Q82_015677 [Scortum barcoo]